jgi:hypothetical protein
MVILKLTNILPAGRHIFKLFQREMQKLGEIQHDQLPDQFWVTF